ncbi:MAG: adenosylcobinamide-GDP ribazoletransferase [Gemmobacter sp.]|nr:adenosylcobinamide-GDP ribazoletransferase [Gemmobacter sp.]
MTRTDPVALADLRGAFGLLTRLPFGGPGRGARSAWAWPFAGAVVGALAGAVGIAVLALGVPVGMAAALVLAVQAVLTGALHEDGLADTFDGLWGGRDPAQRLEIMKDSRVGSYGVLALGLVGLARWSALTEILAEPGAFGALVAVGALSRVPMASVMAALPSARAGGLSRLVGRPGWTTVWLGMLVGVALAMPGAGWGVVPAAVAIAGVTVGLAMVAKARIGGQTGDILGAAQQLAEVVVLAVLAARLG